MRSTDVRPGKPLVCPTCAAKLQPSRAQLRLSEVVALCLSIGLGYLLGLRGVWLAVFVVIFWFPVGMIWHFIFVRIAPPRFEAYEPRPPLPWEAGRFTTLSLGDRGDSDGPKQPVQPGSEPPKNS